MEWLVLEVTLKADHLYRGLEWRENEKLLLKSFPQTELKG